uniref:Uncharacterized protein n=1 Tax=Physcomitrium patens TaxID=3218 RepID=A0A2K1IFN2_PHYPA|nr:hypothetical protein PHYPA_028670 [Physcomitrium patens]
MCLIKWIDEVCGQLETFSNRIETLPNIISELKRFQRLNLKHYKSLQIFSPLIGNLTSLQILTMVNCDQIIYLPSPISLILNFKDLILNRSRQLETLPNTIGELRRLQRLTLKS